MLQSLSILLILVSFQYLLVSMRRLCCYQGKAGRFQSNRAAVAVTGSSSRSRKFSALENKEHCLYSVFGAFCLFVFFPPIAEDGSRMGLNASFLNLTILFQFLHIVVTTINFIYFSYNLLLMLGIVLTLLPKNSIFSCLSYFYINNFFFQQMQTI